VAAAALVGVAALTPVAEGRQISAARATFRVSLQGSYTATATAPYDSCSRWEPQADQPGQYELKSFTMTAKATETAKLHTTKPAILKLAGPYGGIPLSVEGQHYGRETVAIERSSNVHSADGAPDGCKSGYEPGSPQQTFPGDCGSRSRKPGFAAGSSGGRSNRTKISIFAGYSLSDPFQACQVPGDIVFDNLQDKAERTAVRKARPRVSRLFSGSSRIVEKGSATAHGVGTDKGSKATYTMHVKVTVRRSKLERARNG
jgi:hypothetical protein